MKPVLLFVIDALNWRITGPAIEDGRLPNFRRLVANGTAGPCTSIFPSITPAATASIITGDYPVRSGIVGAHWYDAERDEVAYFGDDFWVITREGWRDFVRDFMVRLNQERLESTTLFEAVEQQGMTSACVNFLWYRGTHDHEVNAPWLLKLLPGIDVNHTLTGPRILHLGDFVNTPVPGTGKLPKCRGGMTRRYGFHDESTFDYLLELVPQKEAPEMTVAYFPNNDFDSHDRGPREALDTVEAVDGYLGQLADKCGGMDAFLDRYAVVIVGDHAQDELNSNEEGRTIDLSRVLEKFDLVDAGQSWNGGDDLFVCPNMRAAQVYFRRQEFSDQLAEVIELLLAEERIDQVLWTNTLDSQNAPEYHVRTRDRGTLTFRLDNRDPLARDVYGNGWNWHGDLRTLDARVDDAGILRYGEYPNAMERIVGGFSERSAPLWMTARSGAEFCLPATAIHGGGSHAALHHLDSQSALLTGGLPPEVEVPDEPRIVDVVPLCLSVLGLPREREPGAAHFPGD